MKKSQKNPESRLWFSHRLKYAAFFILLLLTEILIALYVRDQLVRPYVGDMLVVALVYYLVRIWFPKGVKRLPLWVFLFAVAVEISQYFNLAALLGVDHIRAARIILGSTFDWADIACYGVGCLILWLLERFFCAYPASS